MFLIMAVDYFTKWVEAEVVSRITTEMVRRFYWRNIICRLGLPHVIVSDNETQFARTFVIELCRKLRITNCFISVEHPQVKGQADSANKIILTGMEKKLDEAKGL